MMKAVLRIAWMSEVFAFSGVAGYAQIGFSDTVRVQDVRFWRHYHRFCPNLLFNTRDTSFNWLPSSKVGTVPIKGRFRKSPNALLLLRPDGGVLKEVMCKTLSMINDSLAKVDRQCCAQLMSAYPEIWFYGADSSFRWMKRGERGGKEVIGHFHHDDGGLLLTRSNGKVLARFNYGRCYAKRAGASCIVTEHLSRRSLFGRRFKVVHW